MTGRTTLWCGVLGAVALSLAARRTDAAEPRPDPQAAFRDDFAADARQWDTQGGTWTATDNHFAVRMESSQSNAFATPRHAPLLDTQTVEVTVTPEARLATEGWSFAGLTVFFDAGNFWLLALTEAPDKTRYVDFLENCRGVWQAQADGDTKLEPDGVPNLHVAWQYGVAYRLRLELTRDGMRATVTEAVSGKPLATGSYRLGAAEAVRLGMLSLVARGASATFDDALVSAPPETSPAAAGLAVERGPGGAVAILRDDLPGLDLATVDHLATALRAAGFGVTFLSAAQACDPAVLNPRYFLLYAIPNAEVYPAQGALALTTFLRRQGHLLVLGGPAFSRPVWLHQGRWLDSQAVHDAVAKVQPDRLFLDFTAAGDAAGWTRSTDSPQTPARVTVEPGGPEGKGNCLAVSMDDLSGWTTFASPVVEGMFPAGHGLLCFWGRGDAQTSQLSVEMNEADNSRWIAVVPLTPEWTYHVLSPDDFSYWQDSRVTRPRGGSGDRLKPAAAQRVVFGLAHSHTQAVGPGPHTFRVAQVGTAPNPYADFATTAAPAFLPLETVYPSYKLYPLETVPAVAVCAGQAVLDPGLRLTPPAAALSAIPRPTGTGFGQPRKWRWIPLVEARDAAGARRGTVAWMLLNHSLPFRGSVFSVFGVQDQALLRTPGWTTAIVETVRRTAEGVFLKEAGSRLFSAWPDEPVELGATVLNLGATLADVELRLTVTAKPGGTVPVREDRPLSVPAEDSAGLTRTWTPDWAGTDLHQIRCELRRGDRLLDVVTHELGVLPTGTPAAAEFVTVRDGDFWLKGQKWYPVGVNYWALYVSGTEPEDYGLGWFDPVFYEPAEVERDLALMETLGMNMVSIQLGGPGEVRNLLDFLRRCDRHGVKANGFLHASSPVDYREPDVVAYLQQSRLPSNAAVFAYDTIWEPGNWMFAAPGRNRWDPDWEAWLAERYGSVANAEADWGMPVPRRDGQVTSPGDRQLREDGDWRVLVAAYRRFMDDLMSRKWNDATRALKRLVPNQLVSFRQGNTLPHDFAFTATPKHTDFVCPEGYSIGPGEDGYNAIGFITRYVAYTTRGKPIYWSEFGKSCWDGNRMCSDAAGILRQGEYIDLFYRGVLDAGAHGTAPWWWPGGYRVNEKSDFGIINPDGTPRPAAQLIARYAARLKAPRAAPLPDTWFVFDRDAHAGGYWQAAFGPGRAAYAEAHKQGKTLGVKGPGTGTTSANAPLVAVGNRPCTGRNPPKHLNAEFNWLRVRDAKGAWVPVRSGVEVSVAKGKPVLAQASVGNTQEAEWLTVETAQGQPGAVYLASAEGSGVTVRRPLPRNTPCLADANFGEFALGDGVTARTRVVLQMTAADRAWFGEKADFVLVPVD